MKLRSIQVLRAIAAIAVVFIHATANQFHNGPGTFYWGSAGVDLFFVISGFIIGTVAPGQEPLKFLKRRAWRIYPLWWVAFLPFIIVQPDKWTPANMVVGATLWPIWNGFAVPALKVGWTLSFEMLFYLGAASGLATRPAVPLALFAVFASAAPFSDNAVIDFLGNPMIAEFLAGLAISRLSRRERLGIPFIWAGVAGLACSSPLFFDSATAISADLAGWRFLSWGLPAAMIVYGTLCLEQRFAGRAWNLPVLLGDASYSIYLFHVLGIYLAPEPWPLKVGAGVATGLVAYFLLERRLTRLKRSGLGIIMERDTVKAAAAERPREHPYLVQRPSGGGEIGS